MPAIGKDCHLILQHEEVNGGQPYGFVCPKDHSPREGGVQVVRQVTSDSTDETNFTTGTQLWLNFDVLLADDLVNPDGSRHTASRSADYTILLDFLSQPQGIALTTPAGIYHQSRRAGLVGRRAPPARLHHRQGRFEQRGLLLPACQPWNNWHCPFGMVPSPGRQVTGDKMTYPNSSDVSAGQPMRLSLALPARASVHTRASWSLLPGSERCFLRDKGD